MWHGNSHLTDHELIQAIDSELPGAEAARIQAHLSACWSCRTRKQEMERAIGDFVHLYQGESGTQLPSAEGSRALLKAQIAKLAEPRRGSSPSTHWRLAAAACALLALGLLVSYSRSDKPRVDVAAIDIPNPSLTPGAALLVSREQVCRESNTKNKIVPLPLQRKVFEEYGISRAEPRAFEVDYLITPALGGADDIHNLWPQPYSGTVWNARVKDALEDYLREQVCLGNLDLGAAQHEIAGNWIESYKRRFHTDKPRKREQ